MPQQSAVSWEGSAEHAGWVRVPTCSRYKCGREHLLKIDFSGPETHDEFPYVRKMVGCSQQVSQSRQV